MKFQRILLLLVLPILLFSCHIQQKIPFYLENVTDSAAKGTVVIPEVKIQKNDIISIQIASLSTKSEADEIYNQPVSNTNPSQAALTSGYLVDINGNIEHHRLGTIHVEGLTKQELATEIKKRLTEPVELLKDPTVVIRFTNFRVNVLGEVGKPGPVDFPGERLTILEAIGLAGGIPDYGKRNNVRILREVDGQREMGVIDLTSPAIFQSPFYELKQNDVVLVEPTKRKINDQEQTRIYQKITIAFSIITIVATLANIFIK